MRIAALSLFLVLGACGAGSDGSDGADPSGRQTAQQPLANPTTPAPSGKPAAAALSRFRCEPDKAGAYTASGYLTNASKATVTFQVTVQVGAAAATPQKAMTKQVPKVAAGGSVEFTVAQVPAPAEGGPCHVQVVTTK
jgi:hypothetical protein